MLSKALKTALLTVFAVCAILLVFALWPTNDTIENVTYGHTTMTALAYSREQVYSGYTTLATQKKKAKEEGVIASTLGELEVEMTDKVIGGQPFSSYRLTSEMAPDRVHPVNGVVKRHKGTDFGGCSDQTLYAPITGTVVRLQLVLPNHHEGAHDNGYGNYIEIRSDNGKMRVLLAHMCDNGNHGTRFLSTLKVGDHVKAGDPIGRVGSTGIGTGAHLHIECIIPMQGTDCYFPAAEVLAGTPLDEIRYMMSQGGKWVDVEPNK